MKIGSQLKGGIYEGSFGYRSNVDIKYGVIPVGGRGSRLKNIIGDSPKVLTKFEGIEILTYPLLSFIKVEINNLLLISSIFTHKQVKDFADEFKIGYKTFENISIEVINANKKGTAKATLFIENRVPTPFFYTNGDIIFPPEILYNVCKEFLSEEENTIAVVVGSNKNIAPTHPHFIVSDRGYLEKVETYPKISPNSLCSLETAIFSPDIFRYLKMLPQESMTMEALNLALRENKVIKVFVYDGFWYHLATSGDIKKYNRHIQKIRQIQSTLGVETK